MVYHPITINVKDDYNDAVLDIYQNDGNSHEIIFKLIDGDTFYNVSQYQAEVIYHHEDCPEKVIVTPVSVINAYKGYLSWVIGNSVLKEQGRYTVTLALKVRCPLLNNNDNFSYTEDLSLKFILNVVKNKEGDASPGSEVVITKEFYDTVCDHIDDRDIHLSEEDRRAINKITDIIDYVILNKADSDDDVVKILSERQDFTDLVVEIAQTDPDVIRGLVTAVGNINTQLTELVRVPSGTPAVTNIHDFVESYPKWYTF